jgi:hypothetical protein
MNCTAVLQPALVATDPRCDGLPGGISNSIAARSPKGWSLVSAEDPGSEENLCGGQLSYPVPRKRERSLHTCAQDVQITRMATI